MTVKRSRDARTQLHVWNKLLEGRIALQKVVTAIRDLEKLHEPTAENTDDRDQSQDETVVAVQRIQGADESTVKSVSKILTSMVSLRDTYRAKSQFCVEGCEQDVEVSNVERDEEMEEEEPVARVHVDDEVLRTKHDKYNKIRDEIIEKWYEKTKIGSIPKKGYAAMELPTLQLISNAIKDKQRLIRRTQLDRTSHLDNMYHPETFNDDDFYHLLLKELISKDEDRKWVELQRTRYKNKRKADTKATKGRKIKKDLIPKLVNFMAPWTPVNMRHKDAGIPDQIRNELMKSLFGGSVTRAHRQTIDMSDER